MLGDAREPSRPPEPPKPADPLREPTVVRPAELPPRRYAPPAVQAGASARRSSARLAVASAEDVDLASTSCRSGALVSGPASSALSRRTVSLAVTSVGALAFGIAPIVRPRGRATIGSHAWRIGAAARPVVTTRSAVMGRSRDHLNAGCAIQKTPVNGRPRHAPPTYGRADVQEICQQ